MPSSPGYRRDYKQERKTAIRRGETLGSGSDNAKRKRLRRKLEKEGKHLDSPEVAMAKLMDEGYTKVAVAIDIRGGGGATWTRPGNWMLTDTCATVGRVNAASVAASRQAMPKAAA